MYLNGLGVGPGGDQQALARVAQIVDPETFGSPACSTVEYQTCGRKLLLRSGAPGGEVSINSLGSSVPGPVATNADRVSGLKYKHCHGLRVGSRACSQIMFR